MSDMQHSQRTPDGSEPNFSRNEGGCARVFLILLAIASPLLAIVVSVVYRTIGYRSMANRLLWLSIVILVLQLIAVIVLWTLSGTTIDFLNGLSW